MIDAHRIISGKSNGTACQSVPGLAPGHRHCRCGLRLDDGAARSPRQSDNSPEGSGLAREGVGVAAGAGIAARLFRIADADDAATRREKVAGLSLRSTRHRFSGHSMLPAGPGLRCEKFSGSEQSWLPIIAGTNYHLNPVL